MPRFMKTGATIPMDDLLAAVEESQFGTESVGFCVSCGETAYNVEPDARRYTCGMCDRPTVYGAEELLVRVVP